MTDTEVRHMDGVGTCDICGGPLTAERCLHCETQSRYRLVHREIVLLAVLVGVTVAAFFMTRSFAAANQAQRLEDARAWYTQGERALQNGETEAALASLRRAAAKDPNDSTYRLALVDAADRVSTEPPGHIPITPSSRAGAARSQRTFDDVTRVLGRRRERRQSS